MKKGNGKKVTKVTKLKDCNLIVIQGSFDKSSPHAATIKLESGGGAKVIFQVDENQLEMLMRLQEEGKDKDFTIIIDSDNLVPIWDLIQMKEKIIEDWKDLSGTSEKEHREAIQRICSRIDVSKFTSPQIKAIALLSGMISDVDDRIYTEKEVMKILNIKISELRSWKADIFFRDALSETIRYVQKENHYLLWRKLNRGLLSNDPKALAIAFKSAGLIKEGPTVSGGIVIIKEKQEEKGDAVAERLKDLGL